MNFFTNLTDSASVSSKSDSVFTDRDGNDSYIEELESVHSSNSHSASPVPQPNPTPATSPLSAAPGRFVVRTGSKDHDFNHGRKEFIKEHFELLGKTLVAASKDKSNNLTLDSNRFAVVFQPAKNAKDRSVRLVQKNVTTGLVETVVADAAFKEVLGKVEAVREAYESLIEQIIESDTNEIVEGKLVKEAQKTHKEQTVSVEARDGKFTTTVDGLEETPVPFTEDQEKERESLIKNHALYPFNEYLDKPKKEPALIVGNIGDGSSEIASIHSGSSQDRDDNGSVSIWGRSLGSKSVYPAPTSSSARGLSTTYNHGSDKFNSTEGDFYKSDESLDLLSISDAPKNRYPKEVRAKYKSFDFAALGKELDAKLSGHGNQRLWISSELEDDKDSIDLENWHENDTESSNSSSTRSDKNLYRELRPNSSSTNHSIKSKKDDESSSFSRDSLDDEYDLDLLLTDSHAITVVNHEAIYTELSNARTRPRHLEEPKDDSIDSFDVFSTIAPEYLLSEPMELPEEINLPSIFAEKKEFKRDPEFDAKFDEILGITERPHPTKLITERGKSSSPVEDYSKFGKESKRKKPKKTTVQTIAPLEVNKEDISPFTTNSSNTGFSSDLDDKERAFETLLLEEIDEISSIVTNEDVQTISTPEIEEAPMNPELESTWEGMDAALDVYLADLKGGSLSIYEAKDKFSTALEALGENHKGVLAILNPEEDSVISFDWFDRVQGWKKKMDQVAALNEHEAGIYDTYNEVPLDSTRLEVKEVLDSMLESLGSEEFGFSNAMSRDKKVRPGDATRREQAIIAKIMAAPKPRLIKTNNVSPKVSQTSTVLESEGMSEYDLITSQGIPRKKDLSAKATPKQSNANDSKTDWSKFDKKDIETFIKKGDIAVREDGTIVERVRKAHKNSASSLNTNVAKTLLAQKGSSQVSSQHRTTRKPKSRPATPGVHDRLASAYTVASLAQQWTYDENGKLNEDSKRPFVVHVGSNSRPSSLKAPSRPIQSNDIESSEVLEEVAPESLASVVTPISSKDVVVLAPSNPLVAGKIEAAKQAAIVQAKEEADSRSFVKQQVAAKSTTKQEPTTGQRTSPGRRGIIGTDKPVTNVFANRYTLPHTAPTNTAPAATTKSVSKWGIPGAPKRAPTPVNRTAPVENRSATPVLSVTETRKLFDKKNA